jgi:hypothetical protein
MPPTFRPRIDPKPRRLNMSAQQLSPWSTSVALTLLLAAAPGFAADGVRAGFERMLAREPAAAVHPAAAQELADPLIAAVVVPLRDGWWPERRVDAVVESFARMLNHEPNWITPPLPADAGTDPLITAMVWPLLRANHIAVAGQATRPVL